MLFQNGIETGYSKSSECQSRHGKPRTARSSRTASTEEPSGGVVTQQDAAAPWVRKDRTSNRLQVCNSISGRVSNYRITATIPSDGLLPKLQGRSVVIRNRLSQLRTPAPKPGASPILEASFDAKESNRSEKSRALRLGCRDSCIRGYPRAGEGAWICAGNGLGRCGAP